jgi:hypothetical protein
MNNFILALTTGEKFIITKEEAEQVVKAGEMITINRLGLMVQKRMVQVYPQHHPDMLEDRKKQQVGVLHDGEKVRKHYGQWVDYNSVPDDSGNYSPVKLDLAYYPEIAVDMVATEDEYTQIKKLKADYYQFLGINGIEKRLSNKGLQPLLG